MLQFYDYSTSMRKIKIFPVFNKPTKTDTLMLRAVARTLIGDGVHKHTFIQNIHTNAFACITHISVC